MRLIRVDPLEPDPAAIAAAAQVIRGGGLVAFPTETVYGLGANALDAKAVRRIFEAKGRPPTNPLIVHVPDDQSARTLTTTWPPRADRLAQAFWPGPLTLVLEKTAAVPDIVTAGLPSVAVRVPAHPVALALLRAARVPIAAPSANRFTSVSPTTAAHVVKELGDRVDMVLDGGATEVGIESTVLDLTRDPPRLLRPGIHAPEVLAAVAGPIRRARARGRGQEALPSPGMAARHYAPRGRVRLFSRNQAEEAGRLAARVRASGGRVGAIVFQSLSVPIDREIVMPEAPKAYAGMLYAALHALDDAECELILVENVPRGTAWLGVRDRLRRAASPGPDSGRDKSHDAENP